MIIRLVVNGATRNRKVVGYTLAPLEHHLQLAFKGTTIWFWGGGEGLANFVGTEYFFFSMGSAEKKTLSRQLWASVKGSPAPAPHLPLAKERNVLV